jgi:hypothetical protein
MHRNAKPVRKCYACLLNLGDHCWSYAYPRGQWHGKRCPAFENEEMYEQYREWLKLPTVKTGHELRRKVFRTKFKPSIRAPAQGGRRG